MGSGVANWYPSVSLCKNGTKITYSIHRLVAEAFIPNPENKRELHHIDEDKLNNHWTNLMWVTRQEHAKISSENEQMKFRMHRLIQKLVDEFSMRPL
jgi:hypothetical protein